MALILVMAIGTASMVTANKFGRDALFEYNISLTQANGFKAQLLAKAGIQGAMGALKKIPTEMLYQSGIAFDPPPIPLAGGMIQYKLRPEDGKFNLNTLVKNYDDEPNFRAIEYLSRLFEQLGLKKTKIFPVIDWLDTNHQPMGGGAETEYYSKLVPPRKIKNGPMYSLTEILSIKGFKREDIYSSLKNESDNKKSTTFLTDEEKILIGDSDYVLANNLTAYLPTEQTYDERININAAPYYVLMSLSDFMTPQAAKRILKLRLANKGYIKDVKDLEKYSEFQTPSVGGLTLYKELVGEGSDISTGRIKTSSDIFRIIGTGIIQNKVVRSITILYDVKNDKIMYYSEN